MTSTFVKDAVERAVKTFAQALLGFLVGDVTIFNIDWSDALSVTATMVLASILTSFLSFKFSPGGTASLIRQVVDDHPGRHAAPETDAI